MKTRTVEIDRHVLSMIDDERIVALGDERRRAIFDTAVGLPLLMDDETVAEYANRTRGASYLLNAAMIREKQEAETWYRFFAQRGGSNYEPAIVFDIDPIAETFGLHDDVGSEAQVRKVTDRWQATGDLIAQQPVRPPFPHTVFTCRSFSSNEFVTLTASVFTIDEPTNYHDIVTDTTSEAAHSLVILLHGLSQIRRLILPLGGMLVPLQEDWTVRYGTVYGHALSFVSEDELEWQASLHEEVLYPTLYTLGLLNCKNIKTADDPVKRSRQEYRRRDRSGIVSADHRKIVVYLPGAKRHESITGNGIHTYQMRHLVRGHFSTYTPERPLFGKYSGTYWVPAHTRGSKGEADQSYELHERVG